MARNGSGTYSLPSGNPVTTGTTISSTVQNNTMSDIATALTQSLAKDGQTTPTANLPMGGYKHTGAAAGSARTDYATISNLQDGTGIYVSTVGGTADVITLTPSPAITSYTAGQFFSFLSSGANTTNVTVNVSGLGAKAITKNGTTALVANDIPSGALISIIYDGTRFQLVSVGAASYAASGAVTSSGLTMATARLLGRTTASTGAVEEISVGASLTLAGGSISGTAASDTQAGVIEVAIQSEQESASSTTLAVTPGRQQYHPSASKAWAKFNGATVGTNAPTVGYNVATVTRNSTGNYTVNLTTAFSSSDYVVIGTATGNTYVVVFISATTSTFTIETRLTSTGAVADINPIFVVAFGDQ